MTRHLASVLITPSYVASKAERDVALEVGNKVQARDEALLRTRVRTEALTHSG